MVKFNRIKIIIFIVIAFISLANITYAFEIKGICLTDIYKSDSTINSSDIKIVGNRAYVAFHDTSMGLNSGGLDILDITNPFKPVLIKRFSYTMPPTQYEQNTKALAIVGNLIYIANWTGGLCIVDITDEKNPSIAGTYTAGCGGWGTAMHEMVVDGDYLYVAWDAVYGLGILDISDLADIKKICNYGGISFARGVAKKDNYVFVTTMYGRYVRVFDVSDVAHPQLVANISTPGSAWYMDINIVGNLLYIADERDTYGLKIYDITDPENPVYIGNYATSGFGYGYSTDVVVRDNYAYVVFDYGAALFDVSIPSTPLLVSKQQVASYNCRRSLAVGDNAFYFTGSNGDELFIMAVAYIEGTLEWEGSSGYVNDGVKRVNGEYVFKVKYVNADNGMPIVRQLWVDLNDNGAYEEEEKLDMTEEDAGDVNYVDGKVYLKSVNILYAGDGNINCKFYYTECIGAVGGVASVEQIISFLPLLLPANGATIQDITPTFKWGIPLEANNKNLHFKLEITDDATFDSVLYPYRSKDMATGFMPMPPVVAGNGTQFYTMLQNLNNNTTYYWRVSAWNGDSYYISSPVWEFTIQQPAE